jgi:HSP20 family protein
MNMLERQSKNRILNLDRDTSFTSGIEDHISQEFYFTPITRIEEEKQSYHVEIPVPGIAKKDINISVEEGMMWLHGQRVHKKTSLGTGLEYNSYNFHRSLMLPADADINRISASCSDGLLEIKIGKKENSRYRTIEVQGSQRKPWQKFLQWIRTLV